MKLRIKDYIFIVIVTCGIGLFLFQKITNKSTLEESRFVDKQNILVELGAKFITVKVAVDDETQRSGLGGYEILDDNEGMLFVQNDIGREEYTMNNMNFDLDFIFIREGVVVDIARSVSADCTKVIKGATEYDMVIEMRADWTKRNDVKLGSLLIIDE